MLGGVSAITAGVAHASGPTALINGDSVTGSPSVEQNDAVAAGYTVTVVDGTTWDAMTQAQFGQYNLLIEGDPTCGTIAASFISNEGTWAPVVMGKAGGRTQVGNRVLIGTDPVYHGAGTLPKDQVVRDGIAYAGSQPGRTGLYFDTTCGGEISQPGVAASMMAQLSTGTGTWTEDDTPPCGGNVAKIASTPLFDSLTTADLEGWSCSVHESFPTYASDWSPLAVATDTTTAPTCGTDTTVSPPVVACGEAYIFVAGSDIVVTSPNISLTPATATNPVGTSHTVTAHVSLSGSPVVGQLVTFTVTGQNNGATGTCSPVSCNTDSNGNVTFTYADKNGAGTDTILASFTANGSTQQATASKTWVASTKNTDTVTLNFGTAPTYEPQSPVAPGTGVSLEANVNPNGVVNPGNKVTAPTGTITFLDGASTIATIPVNGYLGSAYAADLTSKLATGGHEITAAYSGDTNYPASTSNQVQITVAVGAKGTATNTPTTVGLNFGSAPTFTKQSPVLSGNSEVFSVTVSKNWVVNPGGTVVAPTGAVSFYDGTTLLGTATLSGYLGSGYGSLATKALPTGSNEITAVYNGDGTHPASTSNQVQVTVS
jgi:hypothetical protein